MRNFTFFLILPFVVFVFIACADIEDKSDDIALIYDKEECKSNNGFWDGSKCGNPCEKNPCGHGTCKTTGATTYKCDCENNYFSDGSKCINPCQNNPCGEHGTCKSTGAKTYECDCENESFFDGSKCVNPCKYDPCGEHGTCEPTGGKTYKCECDDGYYLDSEYLYDEWYDFCINPCEENPCGSHGICKATAAQEYECKCDENYFWDGSKKSECVNPCENDPCGERSCTAKDYDKFTCNLCNPNPCGNGTCSEIENSTNEYKCKCDDGNFFDGSKCIPLSEIVECSTENKTPCRDSATGLIWSLKTGEYSYSNSDYFCTAMNQGGFADWRVPTIDELRSLINGCSNTGLGGSCKVSATNGCLSPENCYEESCCDSCGSTSASIISKFGDSEWLWSSSLRSDKTTYLWCINFSTGAVKACHNISENYVRCVK